MLILPLVAVVFCPEPTSLLTLGGAVGKSVGAVVGKDVGIVVGDAVGDDVGPTVG